MRRVDLGAPQRIGMRPQHRLRARRGAGGILHAARRQRIGGAARPAGAVGEQLLEAIRARRSAALRGRSAGVVRNHRKPAQIPAMRRDHPGIGRLRNRGNRAAVTRKIFHLRRRGAGVGGDGDGAEFDAGEPGQHSLDAVIEMNQDEFARLDAACFEPRGERADAVVKFAVSPDPRRRIERRPDQKRMVAARLGPHPQQPRHVHPGKRPHHARGCFRIRHFSSRAALLAAFVFLLRSISATGWSGGQIRRTRHPEVRASWRASKDDGGASGHPSRRRASARLLRMTSVCVSRPILLIRRNLDQTAVGIPAIDRAQHPAGAQSCHWAFLDRHAVRVEMRNHLLWRARGEKA